MSSIKSEHISYCTKTNKITPISTTDLPIFCLPFHSSHEYIIPHSDLQAKPSHIYFHKHSSISFPPNKKQYIVLAVTSPHLHFHLPLSQYSHQRSHRYNLTISLILIIKHLMIYNHHVTDHIIFRNTIIDINALISIIFSSIHSLELSSHVVTLKYIREYIHQNNIDITCI